MPSDAPAQDPIAAVGAPGTDVAALVAGIRERVEQKTRDGVYRDARIARAERLNLASFRDADGFLPFYFQCLRDSIFVDINDFEIRERRPGLGRLLVALKRVIWKLLKFYTYRLWSQQNQVNGLLLTAVEGLDDQLRKKAADLEARLAALEKKNGSPP